MGRSTGQKIVPRDDPGKSQDRFYAAEIYRLRVAAADGALIFADLR